MRKWRNSFGGTESSTTQYLSSKSWNSSRTHGTQIWLKRHAFKTIWKDSTNHSSSFSITLFWCLENFTFWKKRSNTIYGIVIFWYELTEALCTDSIRANLIKISWEITISFYSLNGHIPMLIKEELICILAIKRARAGILIVSCLVGSKFGPILWEEIFIWSKI